MLPAPINRAAALPLSVLGKQTEPWQCRGGDYNTPPRTSVQFVYITKQICASYTHADRHTYMMQRLNMLDIRAQIGVRT